MKKCYETATWNKLDHKAKRRRMITGDTQFIINAVEGQFT